MNAVLFIVAVVLTATPSEAIFPGASWEERTPESVGLDISRLNQLEQQLGGRGCIIKDGYLVKTWGDQEQLTDWASSSAPVLSTLLFFAVSEGLVKSVDQPIAEFGWELKEKDRGITFRQLGAMMSGYARPEGPGKAWAYNDFAMQLYQMTLFDKVFKGDANTVALDLKHLGSLGFQDGLTLTERRRVKASVRDFARIAWFWLNHGRWGEKQLLPNRFFEEFMKPQAPFDLPATKPAEQDDYLNVGSYGGNSDQLSVCGPGTYGFNWWFNEKGRTHPEARMWPDVPVDSVMTIGARGNCSALIPSLKLVLVSAGGNWGEIIPGKPETVFNQVLKLLAESAGYKGP
ncbi:MAG TPA: hypothetical protein PLI09_06885 [Candidatus Hydrogenedentes bacterium]|nr:hypothetical protein [Candidatus Hydrogenedentota bacterium]